MIYMIWRRYSRFWRFDENKDFVCAFFEAEMCVCDIAQLLNMTQSAISHQLRILKQSKLVKNRREGKAVFYSLADGHVRSIIDQGYEHIKSRTAVKFGFY